MFVENPLLSHEASPAICDHLIQMNAPRLNPSQTGWYFVDIPQKEGRLELILKAIDEYGIVLL